MVSPWLSIVLLGVAITGYAWMMPKPGSGDRGSEFVSEAAYDRLLEDLENENRELVDAVAKFKREQDETVEKLGRRIVEMEQQMKGWIEKASFAALTPDGSQARTAVAEASGPVDKQAAESASAPTEAALAPVQAVSSPVLDLEETELPPTTVRGRYPEVLALHDKGRSVEQIAKAMKLNKGEVQLILQLVRREENQHA